MTIGELAGVTGVPTKTIRFYESVGVLPQAERAPNGYRVYGEEDVARLRFVKEAQATGLTLDEISMVMELRSRGESTCEHVVLLLEDHLDTLQHRIAALEKTAEELAAMIERARQLDPADCTDPIRCQTISPGATGARAAAAGVHGAPRPHAH